MFKLSQLTSSTLKKSKPKERISSSDLNSSKSNPLKEATRSKKNNSLPLTKEKTLEFNPQPYRIILRLSGANPSAPAETVTKALRNAGVIFEVEKIERFEKSSSLNKKRN